MKNLILLTSILAFPLVHADETKTMCGKIKNLEIRDNHIISKFDISNRHFEISTLYKTLSVQALIAARTSDTRVCVSYSEDENGKNSVESVKL